MDYDIAPTYTNALIIMTKLALSGDFKVGNRRELFNFYVNGLKVIYYKNRTVKNVYKLSKAQDKINDLIDIGEFTAKLDTNL